MEGMKGFIANRKVQLSAVAIAIAVFAMAGCAQSATVNEGSEEPTTGTATVNYTAEGRYKDNVAELPSGIDPDLDAKNAELNAP